jgi:hypothetical protein
MTIPNIEKIINNKINNVQKSISVELTHDKMDELIFRLTRANSQFNVYRHKSIHIDQHVNVSEESESRMLILKDFMSFKILNLILDNTVEVILNYHLEEICVYENIIDYKSKSPVKFYSTKFKNYIKELKIKIKKITKEF